MGGATVPERSGVAAQPAAARDCRHAPPSGPAPRFPASILCALSRGPAAWCRCAMRVAPCDADIRLRWGCCKAVRCRLTPCQPLQPRLSRRLKRACMHPRTNRCCSCPPRLSSSSASSTSSSFRPRSYLTECVDQMVFESQLPHIIVNTLFTITY